MSYDKKPDTNIHRNHRQKVRERYYAGGFKGMAGHNILEMLLFFGIPYKDTNPIAHELINTLGSLYDVMCAPYEELLRVKGVGPASASLIRTVADTAREANLRKIASVPLDDYPRLAMYATEWFLGKQAGVVAVILLNDKKTSCYYSNMITLKNADGKDYVILQYSDLYADDAINNRYRKR